MIRTSTCEDIAETGVLAADMRSILHLGAKANPLYEWRQTYSGHEYSYSVNISSMYVCMYV